MKGCTVAISDGEDGGLAEMLADRGWDVVVLPEVYGLRPDSPALRALGEEGPLILFSRLRPRAAFWTLCALGLAGRRVESLAAASDEVGRAVLCLDLTAGGTAEELAGRLEELAGTPPSGPRGELRRPEAEAGERWYPVIDYDRCENCGECLEFCLFGVYDTDAEERVVAADPDACKPGCPACSRVCPRAAIMFPLHATEPAIAGADEGSIEPLDAATARKDLAAIPQASLTAAEVARACRCAPGAAADSADVCACDCDCTPGTPQDAGGAPAGSGCPCCDGKSANGEDGDCFDDLVQDLAGE